VGPWGEAYEPRPWLCKVAFISSMEGLQKSKIENAKSSNDNNVYVVADVLTSVVV